MTLTEFLLARIAEDEAAAQMTDALAGTSFASQRDLGPFDPARVLADCKAKRRIIGHRKQYDHPRTRSDRLMFSALSVPLDRVLLCLAQPYADHPDYDPAWQPGA